MATDRYPVGAVIAFGGDLEKKGDWLFCDGAELRIEEYPELCNAIGRVYGGNGENTTFNLPDYRGMFFRGAAHDDEVKTDPDVDSKE